MSHQPADETAISGSVPTEIPVDKSEELIDLGSGGDLTPETAKNIAIGNLTRLIFIAGEAESGKTTLLAAMYEKLNEGPFAGFLFAGSETLVGWEKKCHLARIASWSEKADTERTLGLQQRLLHLRLRKVELSEATQDVLFTDLSGEVFKLIRNSTSECQQLGMLRRADHFVLLIDGKGIAAKETQHETLANSAALLRSCVDAGMIGIHSLVDVVFSKYDLLQSADRGTSEFLTHAIDMITTRFGEKLGRLRFHNVAARPESAGISFAFGIPDLLHSWLEESPYLRGHLSFQVILPPSASQFDNFLTVRLPHHRQMRAWK